MISPFTKVYPFPYKGIVGNGSNKFTKVGAAIAKVIIKRILQEKCVLVSGHSPMIGIDIWSEEIFNQLHPDILPKIFTPEIQQWNPQEGYGYKQRNIDIARYSSELHIIVADRYPLNYSDKKFSICYHDGRKDHIKSGACWTGKQFQRISGIEPVYHIVRNI